jgi:hypothetical protein
MVTLLSEHFHQPGLAACAACLGSRSLIYLSNNVQAQFPFVFNVSVFSGFGLQGLDFVDNNEITQTIIV